ncbi:cytochrome b5 domain-containing protein [Anoxynatronum buryatiense]|uniref:Predicted heme/steroid binding protein n=1 Tax=Anoxynatronum buryatiense TaxID=489973 RepID=A0AA45WZE9_9CLOT|nr:cytochrome b5 domain-containing protein [Anoxynatronum buryatiense]SMP67830.1 Predicted heme/steroid binding protein [Anoxynatronum buryatiense]
MTVHKHHWSGKLVLILLLTILVLTACNSQSSETAPPAAPEETEAPETAAEAPDESESEEDLPVYTLEELAAFNGQDGNPAYVAVDGLVYDFTELGGWQGGTHNSFEAGQDLTEALHNTSPHGDRVLSRAPVVGRLAE